jgi:hypothetical protein
MVPAVAQALQRLTATAMAYPSRPGNTAHRHMRARRDRAKEAGVNINLPIMHDKSSCLGSIRSCLSGRRLPAPIILICARRRLCHHTPVGAHSGGDARVMDVEAGSLIVIAAQVGTAQDRRFGAANGPGRPRLGA